nr:hypothetical protein [Tanacetum cinerariifolium]
MFPKLKHKLRFPCMRKQMLVELWFLYLRKQMLVEHVVEQVIVEEVIDGSFEEDVEHDNGHEAVRAYDVEGIDNACETQYHVESREDAVPDDVLKGEDVDVVNSDGFDSDNNRNKVYDLGRSGKLKR